MEESEIFVNFASNRYIYNIELFNHITKTYMRKNLLLLILTLFSFSAIHADDNGSCGDNLTWKFTSSDGTLTISGTGNMTNFVDERYVPWGSLRDEITKVVIK